jgi:hypothetical protein
LQGWWQQKSNFYCSWPALSNLNASWTAV